MSARPESPFAFEPALVGDSAAMKTVRALLGAVVDAEAPVVLCGERGVGTLDIARWLHGNSPRKDGPLVVVDCHALPVVGVEQHLLGPKEGAVARAAGGVLVLEGVDALPARVQIALLRALSTLETLPTSSRPRVVATLFDPPAVAVRAGRLREDLRFRLGVFTVVVPPLRERRDDLLAVVEHVVKKSCERRRRRVLALSVAGREAVLAHHWPGNVHELEATIDRAIDAHDSDDEGNVRPVDDRPLDVHIAVDATSLFVVEVQSLDEAPSLEEIELRYIHHILHLVGGNKTRAAEVLKVDRRTLYRRLSRLE